MNWILTSILINKCCIVLYLGEVYKQETQIQTFYVK
jgi:hypothetical protein